MNHPSTSAVGYVRVGRVGGRGGDSFISPSEQRRHIQELASRQGLQVVEWLEELDASGGDRTRPKWNRALQMVSEKRVAAILVWNLARFSRSTKDALTALETVEKAGGQLLSAVENIDSTTPEGRMFRTQMFAYSEMERERAKVGFANAKAQAIKRGIYIVRVVPFGYTKNPKTRVLDIDPDKAPTVVSMFERKLDGDTLGDIAHWFSDNGGSPNTARSTIQRMLANRVYIGESYSGEFRNKSAHPAIVSRELFDRVNAIKGRIPKHDGSLSSQCLLSGLVYCQSCGHRMQVCSMGTNPGYVCRTLNCSARAGITANIIEQFVVARVLAENVSLSIWHDSSSGFEEAQQRLEVQETALQDWLDNTTMRENLPRDQYELVRANIQTAVERARKDLELAAIKPTHETLYATSGPGALRDLWERWSIEPRRAHLRQCIESLTVTSAKGKRSASAEARISLALHQVRYTATITSELAA